MRFVVATVLAIICPVVAVCQADGPSLPVVLEHADSLVGTGPIDNGRRDFIGNVRFRQGNVTAACDRAIQNVETNTVDLVGNVVIRQPGLVIRAPFVAYNGNGSTATAPRGIELQDDRYWIKARTGHYSISTKVAVFQDSVRAANDSTLLWADTLIVDRGVDTSRAMGNVVLRSTDSAMILRGNVMRRNLSLSTSVVEGDARLWQVTDSTSTDTLYVSSDLLEMQESSEYEWYKGTGNAQLITANMRSRSATLEYDERRGTLVLLEDPVVWMDSTQLRADTISAYLPGKVLESVVGRWRSVLVSRHPEPNQDRFDQVGGNMVTLTFVADSLREVLAIGAARSVTFKTGETEDQRDGLATVAADSIRGLFTGGALTDVYWLGGVEGEHHPEPVVAGRESMYRVPNFSWRDDKPIRPLPPRRILFNFR